jgi:hypothetical protein
MMNLDITRMKPGERMYAYSQSVQFEGQTGCIGHLRGDFGSGQEFYTTWDDHQAQYKTDEFKAEFDKVVNALRAEGGCGLFVSRDSMAAFCREHPESAFEGNYCTEYGFKLKTVWHTYMLRCNPNKGDYNFYLYAYVSRLLERHMEKAKTGFALSTRATKKNSVSRTATKSRLPCRTVKSSCGLAGLSMRLIWRWTIISTTSASLPSAWRETETPSFLCVPLCRGSVSASCPQPAN